MPGFLAAQDGAVNNRMGFLPAVFLKKRRQMGNGVSNPGGPRRNIGATAIDGQEDQRTMAFRRLIHTLESHQRYHDWISRVCDTV